MYLKSLELQGFKSFPDKTKLTFEDEVSVELTSDASHGVTVIVGPNGSGKSNIADAMRWVLGEISSKTLRGTKMEDVIFGGADSRRPMGYAEVSVTFDNRGEFGKLDCPYDEVIVTRRYFRNGDSEYFINRKGVRLKDIYSLFLNTGIGRDGYSIIGQGRIAEMVSRKSEERRSVFEDASGIAKYRVQKEEAERHLANTHDNLTRVNDIFAEIEAQVTPLEKDAEKARKGMEAYEAKKQADVTLWLYDSDNIRKKIDEAKINFQHASFDLNNLDEVLEQLQAQCDRLSEEKNNSNRETARVREEFDEKNRELNGLSTTFALADQRIDTARSMIEGMKPTLQDDVASQQRAQQNADLYAGKKQGHEDQIAAIEGQMADLHEEDKRLEEGLIEKREKLATASHDAETLSADANQIDIRISSLEGAHNSNTEKNAGVLSKAEEYNAVAESLQKQIDEKEKNARDYGESLASIQTELDAKDGEIKKLNVLCQDKQLDRDNATRNYNNLDQRLQTSKSIAEQLEGYSGAVRHVMRLYDNGQIASVSGLPVGKVYGPLSHLVSVDEKYVQAVGVALGANMQNIVVDTEETAKACIYALKNGKAGRATFFPLTSMKASTPTNEMNDAKRFAGYIGVADTLVKTEASFTGVVSSLLGRTLVFDTIDHATAMARATHFRVRAVTLDGQQINVGGSFTGGSTTQGSNMLSQASEIKRMEEELERQKGVVDNLNRACDKLTDELNELVSDREDILARMEILQSLIHEEEKARDNLQAQYDANETLIDNFRSDLEAYQREKDNYDTLVESLRDQKKQTIEKRDAAEALRDELTDTIGKDENRRGDIERTLIELENAIGLENKDIENNEALRLAAQSALDEANLRLMRTQERIEKQNQIIREAEDSKNNYNDNLNAMNEELNALRESLRQLGDDVDEYERRLNAVNQKQKDKLAEHETLAREKDKAESTLNGLLDKQDKNAGFLMENYNLTSADAVALNYPPVTAENYNEVTEIQKSMRAKLNAIGNFDPSSIEKYAEVKERYDYYDNQLKDLAQSEKDLTDIIATLETDMKVAFVDSFNKINDNFGKVFTDLFGGGHAELSLSDPENVLESGIEIKAAPPGKIIKNLMQLSGGEQSFVGVALFFAILQVNPTPFCILDEIEAALDEVNVERLAQYIKRYSQGTQFIMITHRRGTMAAADRLYGVSMPEQGISKIAMLDINQISKENGELWDGLLESEKQ